MIGYGFLRRQVKEVNSGGFSSVLKKARQTLKFVPEFLVAIPFVVLIRALRPLVLVRIGRLGSHRIGTLARDTEAYLCEKDESPLNSRMFDIFYHTSPISNQQLKKMWDRTLRVSRFAGPIDRTNRRLFAGERHAILLAAESRQSHENIYVPMAQTVPHLSFTPEEEKLGRLSLRNMGVGDGARFVCFHARDSAYLNNIFPSMSWQHHDYRDQNIDNYMQAAEELVNRGYTPIRMGAIVEKPLNPDNPRIIDYAAGGHRTDFLDIFLSAKCEFFISSGTGIDEVATIFRRPVVYVNYIMLELIVGRPHVLVFIPKKLWLRGERRFMTFREILDPGIGRLGNGQEFERLGIEHIENNPEEIKAAVVEMEERLKGTWQTSEEDEYLQQRFQSLFKSANSDSLIVSRIGADFLRQNKEFLE